MVATASASNATKVTASTRPTVSGRRAGAHIPSAGLAAVVEVLAASVLTRVRVEPQPRLRSSTRANHLRHGTGQPCVTVTERLPGVPERPQKPGLRFDHGACQRQP